MKKGLRPLRISIVVSFVRIKEDLMKKGLRRDSCTGFTIICENQRRPNEKGIATFFAAGYFVKFQNQRRPNEKGIATL